MKKIYYYEADWGTSPTSTLAKIAKLSASGKNGKNIVFKHKKSIVFVDAYSSEKEIAAQIESLEDSKEEFRSNL